MGVRPAIGGGGSDGLSSEDLGRELGMLLREQRRQDAAAAVVSDRERELSLYRSGSAPPTIEGSLAAVGGLLSKSENGLFSEEEIQSDPSYLSYYYSHVNLNPRLPPPIISKEDWRFAQRLGGIGDRRKVLEGSGNGSHFPTGLDVKVSSETRNGAGDWKDKGGDGLIGLPGITLGRQKSFAEILQDDLGRTTPISSHPSRPASRDAFDNGIDALSKSETPLGINNEIASQDRSRHGGNFHNLSGTSASLSFASALSSSLSRSTTPDVQVVARVPSPCLPPVGTKPSAADIRRSNNGSSSFNGGSDLKNSDDLVAALAGIGLSTSGDIDEHIIAQAKLQKEIEDQHAYFLDSRKINHSLRKPDVGRIETPMLSSTKISFSDLGNAHHKPSHSSSSSFTKAHSAGSPGGSSGDLVNGDGANGLFGSYGLSGYSLDPTLTSMLASQMGTGNLPPLFESAFAASGISSPTMNSRTLGGFSSGSNLTGATGLSNINRMADNTAGALQVPLMDPLYLHYVSGTEYVGNFGDPSFDRAYVGNEYADLLGMQKGYVSSLQREKQYDMSFVGNSRGLNHNYYGNPTFSNGMSYPGSPLGSSVLSGSPIGPGSPLRLGEHSIQFPTEMRNFIGGGMSPWHSDIDGGIDGALSPSLLDEFKNNKTKCYELSDIGGHVVEFSADQFGSRFIQQKLEAATTEEKNMVFEEIMPQALTLMTDVFGNYVIQKFFDHGSPAQIREFADQLIGHVLTLSLQMYGCRVIQKAIEVVELDQKTKMVKELDGNIMRCVRDQNGNHVIQKCIECIPQDAIQFIITSFYGQVVTLSTHPYGCRIIQRVLEHCDDPKTQQIVMDEIMQCVCMLAQDQYGNYVVQHVLEHGKPHERSAIIEKLAGQIVQMSQQKFASNVVEKCLTFGDPAERQILVNEMLGSTDENQPLQAMMKDQFANYVVQKVLETCDDHQRDLILSRIKVHLNALKKYTYGKHIVARIEKLVAAGERRIRMQNNRSS